MSPTEKLRISQAERLVRIEEKIDHLSKEMKNWLSHCDATHKPINKELLQMKSDLRAYGLKQKLMSGGAVLFLAAFAYGLWAWVWATVPVVVGN